MNLFPLNGGLLNGSRWLAIAASAAVVCSASFGATATRQQDALSPVASGASFVAVPTRVQSAHAEIEGQVYAAAKPTHARASAAHLGGTGGFHAFVLREVAAQAQVLGAADVYALPASALGAADIGPNAATICAEATKRQLGRSSTQGVASVAIAAAPTVTRYVQAQMLACGASLYAETAINGVGESYANVVASCQVEVDTDGLVLRPARAEFAGASTTSAKGTHITHARAQMLGGGYAVFAQPYLHIGGLAKLPGTATWQAQALRVLQGACALAGQASAVQADAQVRHGSTASKVQAAAAATATAKRTTRAQAKVQSSAGVQAQGERIALGLWAASRTATVQVHPLRSVYAQASLPGAATTLEAVADTTIRPAQAQAQAGAAVDALAVATRRGHATLPGQAQFVPSAGRFVYPQAFTGGAVTLRVKPIANPESYDPDERSFIRPALTTDFVRAAFPTEFKRPAG